MESAKSQASDRPSSTIHRLKERSVGVIRSRFLRDGAILSAGGIVTQGLALFTAPIMARLYAPEAYGLLGLYIAVYGILTVPATFQYNQAVILPKEDDEALAIMKGGMALGLITFSLVVLLCFLPLATLTEGTKFAPIVWWTPLMAIMVLPGCFTTFALSWLARKQKFQAISLSKITINLSSTAFGLAVGFSFANTWGLVVGNALGATIGSVVLGIVVQRTGGFRFLRCSWQAAWTQLKNHRAFPIYSTPTVLLTQLTRQSPVLLLTALSGQAAVGFFNMSNRLLGLPNVFFAESFREVFRQRAAKEYAATGQCFKLYRNMLLGLVSTTVPIIVVLAIISPDLFAILLGERWRAAGEYSRILCWLFMFQLVSTPLASMMIIAKRQAEDFVVQIVSSITMFLLMWAAFYIYGTATSMLIAYVTSASLMHVYYAVRGFQLSLGQKGVSLGDGP